MSAYLYPFTTFLWIVLACTLCVIPFVFFGISAMEEKITEKSLKTWSKLPHAAWYAFGSFIGESITRDTRSYNAWALRY